MEFEIILVTPRSLTLELKNEAIYESDSPYDVLLNGKCVCSSEKRNVVSLYKLEPMTAYDVTVTCGQTGASVTKQVETCFESVRLDVTKFGAIGDGKHLDSMAIQAAIMACPDWGTVTLPKGQYYCTPLFMKSRMYLEIQAGAEIIGHTDRTFYPIMPGYTITSDEQDEYYLGTWEGNPLSNFASLITGIHVQDFCLFGEGTINGNASNSDWWHYSKEKIIAWRPRTLFLKGCERVQIQGVRVINSPSWTIHPYFSKHLDFIDLHIENQKDSPNTDGLDPESCAHLRIIGVVFSVGDDCIAIKSGKLYMGKRHKTPTSHCVIRNCKMMYGHGAVVFGSEMAGGIKHIHVSQCIFKETDRGLRIKTRRGRGKDAIIDDVSFNNILMEGVLTPLVINMFYFCDPDGKSEYVWGEDVSEADDWTPYLGKFHFQNMICNDVEVAAGFFAGLPEQPIGEVLLENIVFTYKPDAKPEKPAMMSFIEPMVKQGIYAKNVSRVQLKNVTISGQDGDRITTVGAVSVYDDTLLQTPVI